MDEWMGGDGKAVCDGAWERREREVGVEDEEEIQVQIDSSFII